MNENYELAARLLIITLEHEEELRPDEIADIEQAIKIICPDFNERFDAEADKSAEEYEALLAKGIDPWTGKPIEEAKQEAKEEPAEKPARNNVVDMEQYRKDGKKD